MADIEYDVNNKIRKGKKRVQIWVDDDGAANTSSLIDHQFACGMHDETSTAPSSVDSSGMRWFKVEALGKTCSGTRASDIGRVAVVLRADNGLEVRIYDTSDAKLDPTCTGA